MKQEVIYRGANDEQVRWGNNDDPRPLLMVNSCYILNNIDIHKQHTKYELFEFPNKWFNSVSFEFIH